MDKQEVEQNPPAEDGNHLNRNRSFKTKQLVRSQAIRESASPPRTVSPSVQEKSANKVNVTITTERSESDFGDDVYYSQKDKRKPVEIQITQGTWDESPPYEHRGRAKRWLSDTSRDSARDLLSNNPRVACVCGACAACPQCRGRRRRHICTIKQDSGICADECQDFSDSEQNGMNNDGKKAGSVEVDDQYYCRCPERRDKPKSMLSRTDSDEKSEPTGVELVAFIKETLNKSGKDRVTLLKIEKELYSLVNDTGRCIVKFPVMTSYGRMLVHRCASLFQLSHHLDQSNKNCVIVSKSGTSGGRIPCTNFKTWCVMNFPPPSPQRHADTIDGANAKSILKRDGHSLDSPAAGALAMNRSKSLEQREREYERVRRRIFSTDNCNQDESQWPWLAAGTVKLLAPEPGRNKLLKVQSLEGSGSSGWRGRGGVVSKSHSFGGYGEPATRALSKQGDLASSSWRLSPSSSGYKTLSLRSTDSVTPSPTGGGTPEPSCNPPCSGPVVWAVTDLACVPAGAIVLHPQTGAALTNPDGSLYHFDPANPPVMYDPAEYEEEPKVEQNNEKRRGRLEKQHSFIEHGAECQQTEQYHYEYEAQAVQENTAEKEAPKPVTPTKRYEPPIQTEFETEPANQTEAPTETANQRAYEPANQRPYEPANRDVREIKAGSYQDTVYYGPFASLNRGYNEEVQSPPQMTQYIPEMSVQMLPQAKVGPILQDPNIRPMSLTNMVYPAPPGYQYMPTAAQCRVEPLQQQLVRYQPMLQPQLEEKVATPQPETTFRIDPSYPYAPVDYTAAYGACVDTLQNQPQRSYSVPYNPAEIPSGVAPVYPLHGVVPPLIQYPMHYPEAVQWAPVQTQAMCPVVYPQQYAHYNIVYPQVLPQYQCPPTYPVLDNRRKRNSLPTSNQVTPIITTPDESTYEKYDRQNSDIAAKINQIKEGMMQREGMNRRRDDWKRNSGNGILGSYPVNNYNGRVSGNTDNAQFTTAARAIVNSIRNMQVKNTYQDRRDYSYQRHYDRPDRRRHEDKPDTKGDKHCQENKDRNNDKQQERNNATYQRKNDLNQDTERKNANANDDANIDKNIYKYQDKNNSYQDTHKNNVNTDSQDVKVNLDVDVRADVNVTEVTINDSERNNVIDRSHERTANTDRSVNNVNNVPDRGNVSERTINVSDRIRNNVNDRMMNNVNDRSMSNVNERSINVPDRASNADRSLNNANDRVNVMDRSINNAIRSVDNVSERVINNDRNVHSYQDRNNYQERSSGQDARSYQDIRNYQDRNYQERKYPRGPGLNPGPYQYRPPYLYRQMTPATWCRRSPAPVHPGLNHPRRPHPDNKNGRRY